MTRRTPQKSSTQPAQVRCAIYTRKSTEEGLEQEFNSLDAQRESAEAYIASQRHEGWVCIEERYDDGGFTGGNMERPALKRLMDDIEAGRVDCVIVYKVDRLSRSLLDFARIMGTFEKHGISFVSVTQQFNTASSMGRLVLNVLLSFAQFEREIISERTRDKIAAARRKGKWSGGHPVLGYDVDPQTLRLVVNETEAARVREIFNLYVAHQALIPVVTNLNERGWNTKHWITRKGTSRGGNPFTKMALYNLLTSVVYLGKVTYKSEVHEGEHEAIVPKELWERAQAILARNGRTGGSEVRNRYGALLKGLLHCSCCGSSMGHTYTSKKGSKRYRYYVCLTAQKRGWVTCDVKSVPAGEIERLVVEQIRMIAREPAMIEATIRKAREHAEQEVAETEERIKGLGRDLKRLNSELRRLVSDTVMPTEATTRQIAHLNDRIRQIEEERSGLERALPSMRERVIDEREVIDALQAFDPVWKSLSPTEQARVIQLLIERVDYDGKEGTLGITFRSTGLRSFAEEIKPQPKEIAA